MHSLRAMKLISCTVLIRDRSTIAGFALYRTIHLSRFIIMSDKRFINNIRLSNSVSGNIELSNQNTQMSRANIHYITRTFDWGGYAFQL